MENQAPSTSLQAPLVKENQQKKRIDPLPAEDPNLRRYLALKGISYKRYLSEFAAEIKDEVIINNSNSEKDPSISKTNGREPNSVRLKLLKRLGFTKGEDGKLLMPSTPESTSAMKEYKAAKEASAVEFLKKHSPDYIEEFMGADEETKAELYRLMDEATEQEEPSSKELT